MPENLHKLAEVLEQATPDNLLVAKVKENLSEIVRALQSTGEYELKDESGTTYRIVASNGTKETQKDKA